MNQKNLSLFLCVCLLLSLLSLSGCSTSRTDKLLSGMTLEQKIGQMLMPSFRKWQDEPVTAVNAEIADAIAEYGFGGIILFAENTQGTAQTAELIWDMQRSAKIPMLFSVDQEGGYITRLGTGTATVGNMALGAAGSETYARQTGEIIGRELKALGFHVDFAPDLDVNNNPANPVIGVRSFSDDPQTAARLGAAMIAGIQSQQVAAAVKHFPGHGDTVTDSHSGLPSIDKSLEELEALELIPFRAGIAAGTDLVMTAHIQYPQIETQTYVSKLDGSKITLPATLSKTLITDILRTKLGFQGVVVTDAMNMQAIADHFGPLDAAKLAINAGVDILLMPVPMTNADGIAQCGDYISSIAKLVEQGEISRKTIDSAVRRILTLKEKLGLLDGPAQDKEAQAAAALAAVGSEESHAAEWEIAKAAVTLVKNNGMVPIQPAADSSTVLFCSYENEIPAMQYAIDRLKAEGKVPAEADFTILCYQELTAPEEREREAVAKADRVIASVESYRPGNLTGGWQASFLDALIDLVHEQEKEIAIVSIQLPYDTARYPQADAIAAAYCAKGMSEIPTVFQGETATYGANLPAAVYALLGGCDFTGTLPVNIPALDAEYGFTSEILYPRGWHCG